MKVKSVRYRDVDGSALVVFEEEPYRTRVINLDTIHSQLDFEKKLSSFTPKSKRDAKRKFDDFNLKSFEGVTFDARN